MVRAFAARDLPEVLEIWMEGNMAAHHFIEEHYWTDCYEMVKDALPRAEVYVYEDEASNRIRGFIGLQDDYIAGLFVNEVSRSKGIGRMLLDHAKHKKAMLRLNVFCRNLRGVQFYLRQGFEIQGKATDDSTREEEFSMVWRK